MEKYITTTLYLLTLLTWFVMIDASANNAGSHGNTAGSHNATNGTHGHSGGIHIFVVKFDNVAGPFILAIWLFVCALVKLVFHHIEWLSNNVPESCVLILIGYIVGEVIWAVGASNWVEFGMLSSLFFNYLLPPIILDAGYFLKTEIFFSNLGTILMYAIVGTVFNTFATGAALYGVKDICGHSEITLLQSFLFGALISAVDPVAVLAVFEEVGVNEMLYILVFGESILNDAASVVLYRTFENLPPDNVDGHQVGLAIGSFFVVSIFGTVIGMVVGLLAAFITRFTEHVRVIEPLIVFVMAYMAYLTAETFHFSGIMSILFCGLVMKPYVESNVSRKSHITIKYFMKLMATSADCIIFMFLGMALATHKHEFNIKYIAFTILFISVFRTVGILALTFLANVCGRLNQISWVEQFIMSYGGLRGAVSFCLAALVTIKGDTGEKIKNMLITTTIAVVIFTCVIQGCTIKKLVECLHVRRKSTRELTLIEHVNEKLLSHVNNAVEEISGEETFGFCKNYFIMCNNNCLRRCLVRNPDMILDDELVVHRRKIELKAAMVAAEERLDCKHETIEMEEVTTEPVKNAHGPSIKMKKTHTLIGAIGGEFGFLFNPNDIDTNAFFSEIPEAGKVQKSKKYSDASVGLRGSIWKEPSHVSQQESISSRRGSVRSVHSSDTSSRCTSPSRHNSVHSNFTSPRTSHNGRTNFTPISELPEEEEGHLRRGREELPRAADSPMLSKMNSTTTVLITPESSPLHTASA